MKREVPKLYEGMYIIKASLSDEARGRALDRITKAITEAKGEVLKLHEQGKKRLAYEIDGHREGYYFVLYFTINPSCIKDLWQEYHLNEDLVRFMTLRTERVMEKIAFKSLVETE